MGEPRRAMIKCQGFAHCFFYYFRGVVLQEFLPQGSAVIKEYNVEVMRRLRKELRENIRNCENPFIIHHDNAAAHSALLVRHFCHVAATIFT